jgi:hypothetical protein
LWKYLQLILITVVGEVNDKQSFGDTLNMFGDINEAELQTKLSETISNISEFFKTDMSCNETDDKKSTTDGNPSPFDKMDGLPDLQEHLHSLFNGKIGELAKEMAEDIAEDFKDILGPDELTGTEDPKEIIAKLMKNPQKMTGLLKTVSSKLEAKMKSGDVSKDELMKEASEMMEKMKDIGGQGQFNELFKNITKNMGGMAGMAGMAGMMGKDMKVDSNAFDRMTKAENTKDRLRRIIEQRKQREQLATDSNPKTATSQPDYIHPDLLLEMNELSSNTSSKPTKSKKKKKKK